MKIITKAKLTVHPNGIIYIGKAVADACRLVDGDNIEFKQNDNEYKFRKAENVGGYSLQIVPYGGLRGSIRPVLKAGLEHGSYEVEVFGQWYKLVKV